MVICGAQEAGARARAGALWTAGFINFARGFRTSFALSDAGSDIFNLYFQPGKLLGACVGGCASSCFPVWSYDNPSDVAHFIKPLLSEWFFDQYVFQLNQ